jgi:phosphomannomutase
MDKEMATKFGELSMKHDVGIVTGSALDYVLEQCGILTSIIDIDWEKIHLLPCNGTQRYRRTNGGIERIAFNDMKKMIGKEAYNTIVSRLCYEQTLVCEISTDLELFGTFIQYRGSLLNWCPIGRDADGDDVAREVFVKFDNETNFREQKIIELNDWLTSANVTDLTITLGGETSFDIYPTGWDKTFALQYFWEDHRDIIFVGDKCKENGNDRTIYEACLPRAYETESVEQTIELIHRFLDES